MEAGPNPASRRVLFTAVHDLELLVLDTGFNALSPKVPHPVQQTPPSLHLRSPTGRRWRIYPLGARRLKKRNPVSLTQLVVGSKSSGAKTPGTPAEPAVAWAGSGVHASQGCTS